MDRERSSRRGGEDEGSNRRGRDSRDEGRDRGRDSGRSDERGSRRGREDDGGDGRSSRRGSGGSSYRYEPRSAEDLRQRADNDSKFDKILKSHVKMFKPHDGDNRVRIVPPTWKGHKHWGLDIRVHYGVGADRQTYLDLHHMKGEADPIHEEYERFSRECDPENKDDAKYLKDLKGTDRVLVYLVDRDEPKEGVQAWAMPAGLDRDLVKITQDKTTGEVLNIDDPEEGYDVTFEKNGKGVNTKYEGVSIARRSSPLGSAELMDFAVENPLPDQLVFFEYDYIAKMFNGGGSHANSGDRGESRSERAARDSGRERERDSGNDRGERGRDRDEGRSSARKEPELTWETIHEMTGKELDSLVESDDRLSKVDPSEAKDDEDLADWVCDELGLKKAAAVAERRRVSDSGSGRDKEDPDLEDRLAKMRERRRD